MEMEKKYQPYNKAKVNEINSWESPVGHTLSQITGNGNGMACKKRGIKRCV